MKHDIEVLTVGHSTLSYEQFVDLLRRSEVTAIADVRSAPYSRHLPHFNRNSLRDKLPRDNIDYRFTGKMLGGRPTSQDFYCDGVADYEKMALSQEFSQGLDLVVKGATKHRLALMCSEHDPLDCHRCLLIGRALGDRGVSVKHIYSNGRVVSQADIEERLLMLERQENNDFFLSRKEQLALAYRKRARKVAYTEDLRNLSNHAAAE